MYPHKKSLVKPPYGGFTDKGKGFLISFTGAILFSTKAIIIKKAFHATSADALTLLMLRMLFSLPFYAAAAWWGGGSLLALLAAVIPSFMSR